MKQIKVMKSNFLKDVIKELDKVAFDESLDMATRRECIENITVKIKKHNEIEKTNFIWFFIFTISAIISIIIFGVINNDMKNNFITDIETKQEIIKSYESIISSIDTLSSKKKYVFKQKNGNELTYEELLNENIKLMNQLSDVELKLYYSNIYLDLIKRQYGVVIKHENNSIRAEASKVDSALMLFDSYKDKLRYDEKSKIWSVEIRK